MESTENNNVGFFEPKPFIKNILSTFSAGAHTLVITENELISNSITLTPEQIRILNGQVGFNKTSEDEEITIGLPPEDVYTKTYNLYVGDFDIYSEDRELQDVTNFNLLISILKSADTDDEIIIHINSDGGSSDECIQLMYAIREGFNAKLITTILAPKGYSAGGVMFCIGYRRKVYEDGAIMLHDYSTSLEGQGLRIKEYIDHAEQRTNQLTKSSFVTPGYITPDEYDLFKMGKTFWFTAEELSIRGIATDIILRDNTTISAKEFLDVDR